MKYNLEFTKSALKEWDKLDSSLKEQFRKKLRERLSHPHVESARLSGMPGCYKIKLRDAGYRLVYKVVENQILIIVIAIGKREKGQVYEVARTRLMS